MNHNHFRIGRVHISITRPEDAEGTIIMTLAKGIGGYICVSNVRTVLYANQHEDYLKVMNNALMCLPDGMPLVWMARLWGAKNVERTNGPDLFVSMISDKGNGLKHFLLGDTNETLRIIAERYPDSLLVGTYSPPFCSLEELNIQDISERIVNSGADIVWISMRAPKQDLLAAHLCPLLEKQICIGVGAAFRYALGEYKHPNMLAQKLGLTGFFWRKIGFRELLQYINYSAHMLLWGLDIVISRAFQKHD